MSTAAVQLMGNLTSCSNTQCSDVPGSMANYYQCQQDFCTAEYNACVNHGGASTSSNNYSGGSSNQSDNDTCSEIHYAVIDVCVPAYSECVNNCGTQACADACGTEIDNCIENQKSSAPAQEANNFEDLLECRNDNREGCNTAADNAYLSLIHI